MGYLFSTYLFIYVPLFLCTFAPALSASLPFFSVREREKGAQTPSLEHLLSTTLERSNRTSCSWAGRGPAGGVKRVVYGISTSSISPSNSGEKGT